MTRKRSPLYQGPDAEDTTVGITPGTKKDGTLKTVLNMAFYDDVEILLDQTLLHFSADLDATGIERAIREEFEVCNGDLRTFIELNLRSYEQSGMTPANVRKVLYAKHFRLRMLLHRLKILLPASIAGFIAGGLGTLLLSHFVQERMPPTPGYLRYVLLVLVFAGAHASLSRIKRHYFTSSKQLAIGSIGGAIGGVIGAYLLLALLF